MRVVDGDDAIELRNATGKNIMVPGYENEPYLRFLVNGRVEVNVNSPAKYLNEERYGGVTVPKTASAKAKPRWVLISEGGTYTWHEHRVHWMSTKRPPKVEASDGNKLEKVFDWVVPLSVGGDRVKASGTLWWVPSASSQADALIAAATAKLKQEQKAAAQAAPADEAEAEPAATPEAAAAPAAVVPAETASDSGSPLLWIVIAVLLLALLGASPTSSSYAGRRSTASSGEVW